MKLSVFFFVTELAASFSLSLSDYFVFDCCRCGFLFVFLPKDWMKKSIVLIPLPSLMKSLFVHLLVLSPNNSKFVKRLPRSTNSVLQID